MLPTTYHICNTMYIRMWTSFKNSTPNPLVLRINCQIYVILPDFAHNCHARPYQAGSRKVYWSCIKLIIQNILCCILYWWICDLYRENKIDTVEVAYGVALPSNYIFSTDSDLQGLNSSSTQSHSSHSKPNVLQSHRALNSMPSSMLIVVCVVSAITCSCPPFDMQVFLGLVHQKSGTKGVHLQ